MPSELKKALLTSVSGSALIPEDLDSVLHEELLKLQPLAEILDVVQAEGKTHEYNVRSSHPQGWFEGETTPMAQQSGTYTRATVQLKIARIWGGVTGFGQAVTEAYINALETEIMGAVEGMADVFEYGLMWGIADDIGFTGDAYQYSGIIPRLLKYAPTNVVDAGGNKVELADLDSAIAKTTFRRTRTDPRMWVMGVQMKQVADGLQTKVQIPLTQVELADGKIAMSAYDNIPIWESDFIVPQSTSTSPTLADAIAAGGSLANGDYNYKISSITIYGEQVVSAASGGVTAGTGNNKTNLTWTADTNAKSYMIWRQDGGSGDYTLLDIIPAKTYDSAGTVNGVVEAYTDDGTKTKIAVKPLETGEQNILLLNYNPARGASFVGMVDDMGQQTGKILSYVELARTKDSYDFFLKSYHALRLIHPNLVSLVRHAKLA